MNRSPFSAIPLALFLLLVSTSGALATMEDVEQDKAAGYRSGSFSLGYRGVAYDWLGRSREYAAVESGMIGALKVAHWEKGFGYSVLGEYKAATEYALEGELNYKGVVRAWLSNEKLQHNLDHYAVVPDAYTVAPHPYAGSRWIDGGDRNPGAKYQLEVEQSRVKLKVKPTDYPAHVSLEAWRLERTGEKGLRYLDKSRQTGDPAGAGSPCGQCHVVSRTQTVDHRIDELRGTIDAHLGYVDVILEQLYREFSDEAGPPRDNFGELGGGSLRTAGTWSHDVAPASRFYASTLRLHSSLSGGLTSAASFTYGKRENRQTLPDVGGIAAESEFLKSAVDLGWIASSAWAFNLHYRWLDLDNSNSRTLTNASAGAGQSVQVRPALDQQHAQYRAILTHRPCARTTLKWTYTHEHRARNNTTDDPTNPWLWQLPAEENDNRYRMEMLVRPLEHGRMKVNAWYEYQEVDDVAYGNSAKERQEAFLGISLQPAPHWGALFNLQAAETSNDDFALALANETATGPDYQSYRLQRDQRRVRLNGALWGNLTPALTVGTRGGWMKDAMEQDLLFGSRWNPDPLSNAVVLARSADARQQVSFVNLYGSWTVSEALSAHLEARHIRSHFKFDPDFPDMIVDALPVSADGLGAVSSFTVYQTGASAGLDWKPVENWTWTGRYTYDDYESRDSGLYQGTVQSVMLSLARSW